jgi:hypothetical protein
VSRSLGIAVSVVALAASGCGGGSRAEASTAATRTAAASARPYAITPTRRCLVAAGFRLGPADSPNPRLKALGDLAQRTSFAARSGGKVVGVAFGDAQLIAELLAIPHDVYTIETRRNAVLLYLPSARRQAAAVRACLRP